MNCPEAMPSGSAVVCTCMSYLKGSFSRQGLTFCRLLIKAVVNKDVLEVVLARCERELYLVVHELRPLGPEGVGVLASENLGILF